MTRSQREFFQRMPAHAVKREASERRTQIALVKMLRLVLRTGWTFWHTPNGELRTKETGALLKAMGARAGVFDLTFLSPTGEHYYLELKRGLEPLTDEQDLFAGVLRSAGVPFFVARSYEAAERQLKAWGVIS